MTKGCAACRHGVLSGLYVPELAARNGLPVEPPRYVATSDRHQARLYRCQFCHAWWRFNDREAHVIGEAEVRADFPEVVK